MGDCELNAYHSSSRFVAHQQVIIFLHKNVKNLGAIPAKPGQHSK